MTTTNAKQENKEENKENKETVEALPILPLYIPNRTSTGRKDSTGTRIREGDIVTFSYTPIYPKAIGLVKFCLFKSAFIVRAEFEDGRVFETPNMEMAMSFTVIGSKYENPELLIINKKKDEMDILLQNLDRR